MSVNDFTMLIAKNTSNHINGTFSIKKRPKGIIMISENVQLLLTTSLLRVWKG